MHRQAQVKVKNTATGRFEDVGQMMTYGRAMALANALRARGHIVAVSY